MAERLTRAQFLKFLRGRWAIAAYVIFGAILFVIFLVASFPYGATLSSFLTPFKLKVAYQGQTINLPLGARLHNVKLISMAGPNDGVLLRSKNVTLAPTLGSLFMGSPGLNINAALYGGSVHASVHRRAHLVDVNFNLNSLDLADNLQLINMGAVVRGFLSGQGDAEIAGSNLVENNGDFTLSANRLSVQPSPGFPAIHFGTVFGKFRVSNGVMYIRQLEAHGGDAEIEVHGSVQFDPEDPAESEIKATMYLNPTPEGRHHLGLLLNFLPHPPSAGPYQLSGTLASPAIR
ncbi:MAG: type II secretion system protein GspN [Candidatus Binataceae bacterium]